MTAAAATPIAIRARRAASVAMAFWSRDPPTLAASIAFYTSLSFAPLLTVAVIALARFGAGRDAAFIAEIERLMGVQVADAARLVLASVDADPRGGLPGLVALGAILFSASAVFGQLQTAINRLWGLDALKRPGWRGWLRDRLVSFGMLIGLGMLLLTTFIVSSALAVLLAGRSPLLTGLSELVTTAVIAGGFALLFRYVPYERPAWWRCAAAGAVTALLFQAGKWALGLYFARAGVSDAYGPAGAVVLLMAWSYYVSLLVLAGSAVARPPVPAQAALDPRAATSA